MKLVVGAIFGVLLAATAANAQTAGTPGTPGNSGPGAQGPPDTRTGPSTKGLGASGTSQPWDYRNDAGSGASTRNDGSSEHTTTPSQDSTGVEGAPGGKSGAAEISPKQAGESARHAP